MRSKTVFKSGGKYFLAIFHLPGLSESVSCGCGDLYSQLLSSSSEYVLSQPFLFTHLLKT